MIGFLHPRTVSPNSPTIMVLGPAWERLGYREPVSLALRSAEGDDGRLPPLAAELVALGAGVLIAVGPAAVRSAAHTAVPVVAIDLETDPVRTGLASSFGQPGGNVTGLFVDQPALAGKMIDLLKEAAPAIARVAIMSSPSTTPDQIDGAFAAARARSMDAVVIKGGRGSYDEAFNGLSRDVRTGIVQLGTPGFIVDAKSFSLAAQKHGLPHIAFLKTYARDGILMTYGPRQETYSACAVALADRILRGEKAAELPIEGPTEFELALNLKTARAIGVDFPHALLARADEVIE
jgi:putative ABC transport system substrate-binding protein